MTGLTSEVTDPPLQDIAIETVDVLGVPVAVLSPERAAQLVVAAAESSRSEGSPRYVCATSVHGLIVGSEDVRFREILSESWLVVPDGMPLVWFGWLAGYRPMQRVYGPELTRRVCELSADRQMQHFFYGGAPGVADELAERMRGRFPGLVVAGTYCPPFRPLSDGELAEVAEIINGSRADIVWVGLSTPRQERWISAIRGRLKVKVLVSVGAAFDFHTGRLRQAPSWIQRAGFEWLLRLMQEPGRLWRRYAYNNPRFVYLALRQLLRDSRS